MRFFPTLLVGSFLALRSGLVVAFLMWNILANLVRFLPTLLVGSFLALRSGLVVAFLDIMALLDRDASATLVRRSISQLNLLVKVLGNGYVLCKLKQFASRHGLDFLDGSFLLGGILHGFTLKLALSFLTLLPFLPIILANPLVSCGALLLVLRGTFWVAAANLFLLLPAFFFVLLLTFLIVSCCAVRLRVLLPADLALLVILLLAFSGVLCCTLVF